jgi:hypothetical protein
VRGPALEGAGQEGADRGAALPRSGADGLELAALDPKSLERFPVFGVQAPEVARNQLVGFYDVTPKAASGTSRAIEARIVSTI